MTATVASPPLAASTYRADIDGMRAIAIVLVVAFHAGLDRFSGGYVGVDVFFVLSGFLITGLLVKQHVRDGRISLRDFYARRARRLLPLAGLVLVSTLALGTWLLPPLSRIDLFHDVRAAAVYLANWRFASQATAYSDAEVTDSLLLHYWSLSIEEQFYVLWPLLIILSGSLVRRRRPDLFVPVLSLLLLLVVVGSLTASVILTPRLGPESYYVTHTRLWEMGVGAGLALYLPRLRALPRVVAEGTSVVGLTAIMAAAVLYDAATPFPGSAALVPVLGTTLLLFSAHCGPTVLSGLLGLRPMTAVGRWSYAWYLWHWPLIGAALLLNSRSSTPWSAEAATATAVVVSLGLAALSHHFVENPVRFAPALQHGARRSLVLGASLTLIPIGAVSLFLSFGNVGGEPVTASTESGAPESPGTDPAWQHLEETKGPMSPLQASEDVIDLGEGDEGCHIDQETTEARVDCVFGDVDADVTVVLVGDSHARHWLPAFDEIGRHRGWRVVSATKSACTPIDAAIWNANFEREYEECELWRQSLVDQLRQEQNVGAVFVSRSRGYRNSVLNDEGERLSEPSDVTAAWELAASRTFEAFTEVAPRVVVFRDTPWSPEEVATCLSEANTSSGVCDFSLAGNAGADAPLYAAEWNAAPDGVSFIDPTVLVCPTDPCEVVADDGTIRFRDRHHFTQTFSRQLAPALDALLPDDLPSDS